MNRVEAFEYAQSKTSGEELNKAFWLKSLTSEVWLERRSNYTRTLGVMCIVGYILGLGDRHPSNIMIDRQTGKIIEVKSQGKVCHIDFGDCFEVAINRDKYPETVPFRLTRMCTRAMEVNK